MENDETTTWTSEVTRKDFADIRLVEQLRAEEANGDIWRLVRGSLAQYALRTLHQIILSGKLNERTRRLGRPVNLSEIELRTLQEDLGERSSVIDEAIVLGLRVFKDEGILKGGWRPSGGANLRTYAINSCLMQMSRSVRSWRRMNMHSILEIVTDVDDSYFSPLDSKLRRYDPANLVEEAEGIDLDSYLPPTPEWLKEAISRRLATDHDWSRIADEIGVTSRALEGGLRRLRTKLKGNPQ